MLSLGTRIGAGALGGMGLGWAGSGFSSDYGGRDALIDGGLGAVAFGPRGAGAAYNGGRMAYGVANSGGILGGLRGLTNVGRAGLLASRAHPFQAAMLPTRLVAGVGTLFNESPGIKAGAQNDYGIPTNGVPDNWGLLKKDAKRKQPLGPAVPPGLFSGSAPTITVNPVAINYAQGKAPAFNKTLQDYLKDKQLQGLVNTQIFQMNKPLMDANAAEQRQRARDLKQNEYLGKGVEQMAAQRVSDAKATNADIEARADARRKLLAEQTALAEGQVPITYMEGEAAKAKSDAGVSAANESALSDALIDRLARAGETYLEDLKGASSAQTRVDANNIVTKADEQIKSNVNQIRANQMQRGSLLGTLAAQQYENAIQLHNLNMDQYNKGEDRRYSLAADKAKMDYDAQVQNANNAVSLLGAASSGKVEPTQEEKDKAAIRKDARDRMAMLNDEIEKLRTQQTPVNKNNPEAPRKLVIQTKDGKNRLHALQQRRDRIKKQYGF